MKICPVAIAVGCPKCPVFSVCPAKAAIGGYVPEPPKAGTADEEAAKPKQSG